MKQSHIPVLVVGGGPVGMTIAAMLRRHGLKVRVVERSEGPTPYSKAVGVHAITLESMHALGLSEQLVSDGRPLHRFRIQEEGRAIMSAGFTGIGSPYEFVLGLPQSRTEQRLLSRLQAQGGDVEWRTELVALENPGSTGPGGTPAQAVVRHADGSLETITAHWLIGADGGRSSVREFSGIGFPGGDYGKSFILGDACIDWDGPKGELQFFISPHGYLLLVPMPDGLHRIIAQTERRYEEFQGAEKPVATLAELQAIVDRNGPGGIRVHSPAWLTCAPFYHRCADTPLKGRVLLAGDAFHLYSPLGAQGLNTGFQDCFNLAWKLAFIEQGWAGPELLETYSEERLAMVRRIGEMTAKTTRYITSTEPMERQMRQDLTSLLNDTPRVQQQLPRLLAGVLQSYGPQARLSGHSEPGLPAAGGRIPHAWLPDGLGYRPIASLVHGVSFTLLLLRSAADPASLAALQRFSAAAQQAGLPFLQICVVTREPAAFGDSLPAGVRLIEDRLGEIGLRLGCQGLPDGEASVLVRPDGYCAYSARGWDFDALTGYFRERAIGPGCSVPAPATVLHAAG